ncbi:MAG TPA: DUF2950 family protein, partial [Silvibacterium sp.]|nr:DUF2950 family protein [Silvibacterium sp.]
MMKQTPRFFQSIASTFALKARGPLFLAVVFGLSASAIAQTAAPASAARPEHATMTGQKTFPSAEAGVEALYAAAKSGDTDALLEIFGPGGKEVISSG